MRLLVCGGRYFDDVPLLWSIMDSINKRRIDEHGDGIRLVIEGGQCFTDKNGRNLGADHWAHEWANARNVANERYFADWASEGRAAGPIRNKRMFLEGKPSHGLAMPGGSGTANMVSIMRGHIPLRIVE